MNITITLTEDEASTLYDVLDHTSRDIEDRLPDCENDPDEMELWKPLYDAAQRVMELIEAKTTEKIIKFCECDEPENETFDGGRTVRCVICGGE